MNKYEMIRRRTENRISELQNMIDGDIVKDIDFKEKLEELVRDYKSNKFEICNLISCKIEQYDSELAELICLDSSKDFAYIEQIH